MPPDGHSQSRPASPERRLKASWMVFARALGQVNSAVLLTIAYFAVLGPIALLHRWLGGDPLRLKEEGPATFTDEPETSADSPAAARRQF